MIMGTTNELKMAIVSMLDTRKGDIGLREVVEGAPYFNEIEKVTRTPIAFVTTDQEAAQFDFAGTHVAGETPFDGRYRFGIILVVSGKDGRKSEMEIDDISDYIVDVIKSHPHLPVLIPEKPGTLAVPGTPPTGLTFGEPSTKIRNINSTGLTKLDGVLYSTDAGNGVIHAYDSDFSKLPDIPLDPRNDNPGGIASDGTSLFVTQLVSPYIYRYTKTGTATQINSFDNFDASIIGLTYHDGIFEALQHVGEHPLRLNSEAIFDNRLPSMRLPNIGREFRSIHLSDRFTYVGFERDLNNNPDPQIAAIRRSDNEVVATIPGNSNGIYVEGDTLYRGDIAGNLDTIPITFTGGTDPIPEIPFRPERTVNLADYMVPEMVGAREIGDKKLARYIRVRVAVTEVSGSSTSS